MSRQGVSSEDRWGLGAGEDDGRNGLQHNSSRGRKVAKSEKRSQMDSSTNDDGYYRYKEETYRYEEKDSVRSERPRKKEREVKDRHHRDRERERPSTSRRSSRDEMSIKSQESKDQSSRHGGGASRRPSYNESSRKEYEKKEKAKDSRPATKVVKKKKRPIQKKAAGGRLSFGDELNEDEGQFKGLGAATTKRLKDERQKGGGTSGSDTASGGGAGGAAKMLRSEVEQYYATGGAAAAAQSGGGGAGAAGGGLGSGGGGGGAAAAAAARGEEGEEGRAAAAALAPPRGRSAAVRGRKAVMEDRCALVPNLQPMLVDGVYPFYAGVFDGHNGCLAAEIAAAQLHARLAETPELPSRTEAEVQAALLRAFAATEDAVNAATEEEGKQDGTTALVVVVIGKTLYVANVGDTRAVLGWVHEEGKKPQLRAERLSVDHKPDTALEKRRVEMAGGGVQFSGCWRVSHEDIPMRLAVARSLGDRAFKDEKLVPSSASDSSKMHKVQLVSPVPNIRIRKLGPKDKFIILATDGLWDVVDDAQAVRLAGELLLSPGLAGEVAGGAAADEPLQVAAERLVQAALDAGAADNVTAAVVGLHWDYR